MLGKEWIQGTYAFIEESNSRGTVNGVMTLKGGKVIRVSSGGDGSPEGTIIGDYTRDGYGDYALRRHHPDHQPVSTVEMIVHPGLFGLAPDLADCQKNITTSRPPLLVWCWRRAP